MEGVALEASTPLTLMDQTSIAIRAPAGTYACTHHSRSVDPGFRRESGLIRCGCSSSLGTVGVVVRAQEMQRDIWFVPDHPAVVSWCDVEDVPRAHLGDGA